MGRRFEWRTGGPVEVQELPYGMLQSASFQVSSLARTILTGTHVRRRAGDPADPADVATRELFDEGFTELCLCPITFLSGEVHAVSFGTRRPGGFEDEHVEGVLRTLPALSRIAEILALTRTAANLLDTYVGRNAGGRILAGKIQRGDVDTIHAVMWFSDLRDFTALASELPPDQLIRALNELFECQVPAIERRSGEVLKFMGDGLFAIFPIVDGGPSIDALCDGALDAAAEAFAALAATNVTRRSRSAPPLRFGLALHVGEVAYGNIGGAGRLDFTCIGPAVNLAARLEGVASKLGRDVVLSDGFRRHTTRPVERLGDFQLKGVPAPETVWAPGPPSS
jgi:adenylate cyclase